MWYSHYESSTWEKVFRYLLGVVITLWIIVSFIMGYFYLLATGSQITKKGGTFVEGIFDQISYLPYLKNDEQSSFYQNFLFRSCLHPYALDEEGNFSADLCRVYTEDNKNFVVRVEEGISWSDGGAVTIDDVFFTYDEIIRQNRWGIQSLNVWNAITVALEDGKVKVEFPDASESNMMFFTNYLLPKHILYTSTLEDYRTNFSLSPIYNSCGSIVPQIKDINSLIFDL